MRVTKRNGKQEDFDISKIKKMIAWATDGLDVNPLELESHLSVILKDGVSTAEIHNNSIIAANNLTSIEAPDWRYAAGRLYVMQYWKELKRKRGYIYSLKRTMKDNVKSGLYDWSVLEYFSDEDLDELNSYIKRERDMLFDFTGAHTLVKRYLLPNENIQELFMVISIILSKGDKEKAKEIYDVISTLKISLATPILLNLRRPNGNLTSCFILQVEDNLDSMMDVAKEFAFISKNAGAAGIDLSRIRATGSWIKHQKGAAGGVVPYVKVLNDLAVWIDQMGKRAGSVTPALPVWHHDFLEYLDTQTEVGEQRKKAHDVFLQAIVNDVFMERIRDNGEWVLVDPYEVKLELGIELYNLVGEEFTKAYEEVEKAAKEGQLELVKTIRARELFKHIMATAMIKGVPYWAFKDTMNEYNPAKDIGLIPHGNLCMESFSVVTEEYAHSCNLLSIVTPRISSEELPNIMKMAVEILDNIVDIAVSPIERANKHNQTFRVLGIGFIGFADWMAYNSLSYEREEDLEEVSKYFERTAIEALKASVELAKEKGVFPAYEQSEWAKGKLYGKPLHWYKENSHFYEEWKELAMDVEVYGVRNLQLFAIAPNSSTGLLQGVTPSILPAWDVVYMDSSSLGNLLKMPLYIKEKQWYYKPYKYYDMTKMNSFIATVQKWIDSGISYEVTFDLEKSTIQDVANFYLDAWKKGVKTVYYIRWIQPNGATDEVEYCVSCAN